MPEGVDVPVRGELFACQRAVGGVAEHVPGGAGLLVTKAVLGNVKWTASPPRPSRRAALLLVTAGRAPPAPAVTGTHVVRYTRLAEIILEQVSPQAHEKIAALASLLPRTAVV